MNVKSWSFAGMFVLACFLAVQAGLSGSVRAVAIGNSVRIGFSVTDFTDATVDILDSATGRVVRHLASGRLGPRAPLPFNRDSLSQSLVWDMRDDEGLLFQGAFVVRVRTGLSAHFDRIYSQDRLNNGGGYVVGLAADTNGDVAVLTRGGTRGEPALIVYGRDGSYKRTLQPFPSDLPDEKTRGFGRVIRSDGKWSPLMTQGHHGVYCREFHFPQIQTMAVSPQNWLVMANSAGNSAWYGMVGSGIRRALVLGMDGSCPRDSLFGPGFPKTAWGGTVCLSLNSTGTTLFTLLDTSRSVFRCAFPEGRFVTPISGITGLARPRGLDVDNQGRLYVCDSAWGMVIVFDSLTGAGLDTLRLAGAYHVRVNRKNGELFVMALNSAAGSFRIVKYGAYPSLDSVCHIAGVWDKIIAWRPPRFVLDDHAAKAVVWAGSLMYSAPEIKSWEDQGDSLSQRNVVLERRTAGIWAGGIMYAPGYLAVDPQERFLFAGCNTWSRLDLATGAITRTSSLDGVTEAVPSPDGTFYGTYGYNDNKVRRFNAAGSRIALGNGALEAAGPTQCTWGPNFGVRGFQVLKNNRIYFHHCGVARPDVNATGAPGDVQNNYVTVCDTLFRPLDTLFNAPHSSGGMQVNNRGEFYVCYNSKPRGMAYGDPAFKSQLPDPLLQGCTWAPFADKNYYLFMTGSVYKFPPSGGHIGFLYNGTTVSGVPLAGLDNDTVPELQVNGNYDRPVEVKGALWQYHGIYPQASLVLRRGDPWCECFTPRFAVDGFNRVFLADASTQSVAVLDDNRNEILRFGSYGNADQLGEGSARPNPSIPLTYPAYVYQVNNSVYISDPGSRRIVRVRLEYADSAFAGAVTLSEKLARDGSAFQVKAFPVPSNPDVKISVKLPVKAPLTVEVFGMDGRLVKILHKGESPAGVFQYAWDGGAASGAYFIKVSAGKNTRRVKCVIMR